MIGAVVVTVLKDEVMLTVTVFVTAVGAAVMIEGGGVLVMVLVDVTIILAGVMVLVATTFYRVIRRLIVEEMAGCSKDAPALKR